MAVRIPGNRGGVIPRQDYDFLFNAGAAAIFDQDKRGSDRYAGADGVE